MVDLLGMFRRRPAKRGPAGFARSRDDITALGDSFGDMLTNPVREMGMRELYRMNITYATLFPDLDGLARSLGYELEFHWGYNTRTMEKYHT